jgi:putative transposase
MGPSWRMDETYVLVEGTWKYLYRVVDKAGIGSRQIKYFNNIVELDHRAIKRLVWPMGFKSFRSAGVTLAGVELMHMIWKGLLRTPSEMYPARQFYWLAG